MDCPGWAKHLGHVDASQQSLISLTRGERTQKCTNDIHPSCSVNWNGSANVETPYLTIETSASSAPENARFRNLSRISF